MSTSYKILFSLILLLVASLFLPVAEFLKSLLAAVLFLYVAFNKSVRIDLSFKSIPAWLWCMLAFFAWLLISVLISDNHADGWRFIEKRIPLILLPCSLGLVKLTYAQRNSLLVSIAWLVTLFGLYALSRSFIQYIDTGLSGYLYNDAISIHIGQQSIYTSLFVNASIYIFAWQLLRGYVIPSQKPIYVAALVFLFILSYLLASRNMMLLLYGSIILIALIHTIRKQLYKQGALFLVALGGCFLIVYNFFPKTLNRFKELTVTKFDYSSRAAESHYDGTFSADQWNGANFRLAVWSCGWQLFKEHPLFGTGIGDKRDELNRLYRERKFHFAIETRKNVHNNYLDILYSTGIIGILLFILAWVIHPFFQFIRKQDSLALLIHITLLFAMITEVYFDRSLGPFTLGLWISILLSSGHKRAFIN